MLYLNGGIKGTVAVKKGEKLFTLKAGQRPSKADLGVVVANLISGSIIIIKPNGEVITETEITKASMEAGVLFDITQRKE